MSHSAGIRNLPDPSTSGIHGRAQGVTSFKIALAVRRPGTVSVSGAGRMLAITCAVTILLVARANSAELKSDTAAAFDRYIRVTERQMADDLATGHFLAVDRLPS